MRKGIAVLAIAAAMLAPMAPAQAGDNRPTMGGYWLSEEDSNYVNVRLYRDSPHVIELCGLKFITFKTVDILEYPSLIPFVTQKENTGTTVWLYLPKRNHTVQCAGWYLPTGREDMSPEEFLPTIKGLEDKIVKGTAFKGIDLGSSKNYEAMRNYMNKMHPDLIKEVEEHNFKMEAVFNAKREEEARLAAIQRLHKIHADLLTNLGKPPSEFLKDDTIYNWGMFHGAPADFGGLDVNWLIYNLWYYDFFPKADYLHKGELLMETSYRSDLGDMIGDGIFYEKHCIARFRPYMNISLLDMNGDQAIGNKLVLKSVPWGETGGFELEYSGEIALPEDKNPEKLNNFLFINSSVRTGGKDDGSPVYANNQENVGWRTELSKLNYLWKPVYESEKPDVIEFKQVWVLNDNDEAGSYVFTGQTIRLTRVGAENPPA